ncbi:MAG: type II secretion system F family protein [Methanophagales archaeon]|nr:type II secretion system F family protein [Methanophagales archaeon]
MEYKSIGIEKFAYSRFGKYYRKNKEKYAELSKALLAARYPITYDIYLSNAFFYSVIAGVTGLVIGFVSANMLARFGIIPINYSVFPSLILKHGRVLGTIFLSSMGFLALFGITYAVFYLYPSSRAGDRRREIDRMMPHAVHFMYALSKSGVGILNMIKSLANHVDTYGEIGKEMDFVVRNVDYFGKDLRRSLIELSETTPSHILRGFISGILTVIESGGDIQIFLVEKVEQYTEHARVEQKGFLETLGLLAEVYITIIVAAPLFFIIVQIIMLAMGSGSMTMIYGIVYVMIPLGSAMFIFMIYVITPSDVKRVPVLKTEFEVKKERMETEGVKRSEVYRDFKKAETRQKLRDHIKKPFEKMWETPVLSLGMSAPLSLALLLVSGMRWYIPALLVAVLPLALFHESKSKYERRIRNQTPDVLRSLSSSVASGLTLMKTIEVTANAGEVGIYKEVKKMHRGLEWGAEVSDAFRRFANAIKVASLIRAVTLLTEVLRTGGNMPEALGISAKDAEVERTLVKERAVNMLIYIIIIYIAFFIFIGIIYLMFTSLLPPLFESFKSTAGIGGGSGIPMGGGLSKEELSALLAQAAMFQSIFCGLMAGQMGEGNILSGLKHVLVMLFVTWVMFTFLI